MWTVGSCSFASLDRSRALDDKESKGETAEIWIFGVP